MTEEQYKKKRIALLNLASDMLSSNRAIDFDKVKKLHDQVRKLDQEYSLR